MVLSYRGALANIGADSSPSQPVSWASFFVPPRSLRALIRSTFACTSFNQEVPGDEWDADWTDEIQGVCFKKDRWFFVRNQNGNQALRVLRHPDMKKLQAWSLTTVPPADVPGFAFHHFGAIQSVNGELWIDHWFGGQGQVLVMAGDETAMTFVRWINLERVPGGPDRLGMIAVDIAGGFIITSGGETDIKRLYRHDLEGRYTGRSLTLQPGINDGCYAQGGFWSPNNLVYVSSGQGDLLSSAKGFQYIYCFSPLNGRLMGKIPVPSKAGRQELEGCCYAAVERNGKAVQIHCVLLENEASTDDIYFKSFSGVPAENI